MRGRALPVLGESVFYELKMSMEGVFNLVLVYLNVTLLYKRLSNKYSYILKNIHQCLVVAKWYGKYRYDY